MTSMELEAQKALLVRDILTEIHDMDMVKTLRKTLERMMKTEVKGEAPCQYTREEMQERLERSYADYKAGKNIVHHEDVMKEMDELLATL